MEVAVTKLVLIADEVCGEAGNGREAVQLAEECKPDLIVLDLSMPGDERLGCRPSDQTSIARGTSSHVQQLVTSSVKKRDVRREYRPWCLRQNSTTVLITKARLLVNQIAA
jgi:DNA-binding NarL/FixJ family response regulator